MPWVGGGGVGSLKASLTLSREEFGRNTREVPPALSLPFVLLPEIYDVCSPS